MNLDNLLEVMGEWEGRTNIFSYLFNYSKCYGKRKTKSVGKYHMIFNTSKVILDISQTTTSQ